MTDIGPQFQGFPHAGQSIDPGYAGESRRSSLSMGPTCTNIRIRNARDAEIIFHAVRLGMLPLVTQRLGSEERMSLRSGCVYAWEERKGHLSESMGQIVERKGEPFIDGRSWGPVRYRYS